MAGIYLRGDVGRHAGVEVGQAEPGCGQAGHLQPRVTQQDPGRLRLRGQAHHACNEFTALKTHRRKINTEEKAKVVAAVWETELIQFFVAALAILQQDDFKKRMNRITATWQNRCFGKMDYHPVHNIPNRHPTNMDVLPKTFVQIILSTKWLVRHSSTSPNQQRRRQMIKPLSNQSIMKL